MKGEFINCVYYEGGEYDFKGDSIENTLAIHDDMTIEVFMDDVGIRRIDKTHEDYNAELVDIILRDPESDDASDACEKLIYMLIDDKYISKVKISDIGNGWKLYTRG